VTIPPNANGRLRFSEAEAATYTIDGHPLVEPFVNDGKPSYGLSAGTYSFEVTGVR
jgi:hypothetical protein